MRTSEQQPVLVYEVLVDSITAAPCLIETIFLVGVVCEVGWWGDARRREVIALVLCSG